MRISSVGWYSKSIEELKELVKLAVVPTHNSNEGIEASEIVAISIYLLKNGYSKEDLKLYIARNYKYNLNEDINEYVKKYKYTSNGKETVRPALVSFLNSTNYENSIRNAVSFGGDTDTIATINSSIAEAYYKEIPKEILEKAKSFLSDEFIDLLKKFKFQ